jgi:hypothetical protein
LEARKAALTIGVILLLLVLATVLIRVMNGPIIGPVTSHSTQIRVIRTAEATYAHAYPKVGFAPNLTMLGGVPGDSCGPSHACLLDNLVACPEIVGQGWCSKGNYRYNVQSSSKSSPYKDYWLSVTPISRYEPGYKEAKSYCLTSDGKLRSELVTPLVRPYALQECLALPLEPTAETAP